jgi:DNA polymerase-3 subunit delta
MQWEVLFDIRTDKYDNKFIGIYRAVTSVTALFLMPECGGKTYEGGDSMVQIWLGNEPFLMNEEMRKAETSVECPEMDFIKGDLDEDNFYACDTAPMFSQKKLLFLYSSEKNPFLERLVEDGASNDVVVIMTGEVDKRRSVYKKAEKKKLIRNFGRLNAREFDSFCRKQLEGVSMSNEVYGYLTQRMAYGKREDCDLYAVANWLGQIATAPQLNKTVIDHLIPEYQEEDVFRLFSLLTAKNGAGYFKMLDRLLESDPKGGIGIMSVLLRNFRVAYKAAVAGSEAVALIGIPDWQLRSMKGITMDTAKECMNILQESVNRIKAGFPQRIAVMDASSRILSKM